MQVGLEAFRATDAVLLSAYFSGLLAEAYEKAGKAKEELNVLASLDNKLEPWWGAELCRLKGELILKQPDLQSFKHREREAAECFRQAVTIARAQKAKSLELRATISLCGLWLTQSKRLEARHVLEEILAWFTGELDTPDLQEAKVLLGQL